jgi:hypothetical protein
MRSIILKKEGLRMETKKDIAEKKEENVIEEWEKPSVKELDVNAITLSGAGLTWDGASYS